MRNDGQISPSTASEYMRNCIMFYRWVMQKELLAPHVLLWREKPYVVKFFDRVGFERTITGTTTDLSIPNRKRPGLTLEDGLLPVSESGRDAILDFAAENATPELYLMLALGFLPACGSAASVISSFRLWNMPSPTLPLRDYYVLRLVRAQLRQCTRNSA